MSNENKIGSSSTNIHTKNPVALPSSPSLLNKQYHISNNGGMGTFQTSTPSSLHHQQKDSTNQINDLTQIKYLKNNYNIQYYPSDFISFTQQSQENLPNSNNSNVNQLSVSPISPSQNNSNINYNNTNNNKSTESKPNNTNNTSTKLSDFIINNNTNNGSSNNANNVNTAKNNSVSSSSSSSTTSSSSSHSNKSLPNNITTKQQQSICAQQDINAIDVNSFLSSLNQKKTSPSPQKSTTSTSNSTSNQNDGVDHNNIMSTNLKNVKSLTNLYESKFTYQQQQPPSSMRQISLLPSSSSKLNNSTTQIDFNSIFNSKINPNANTTNNNNSTGANPNQLSSSSSSSTSSSSSSNHLLNHQAQNPSSTNTDLNNNNKNLDNQNQFHSRSLNAFNQTNTQQQNRDEINLSVKNVIKLLETNSLNSSSQPTTTVSSTASSTNSQPPSNHPYTSYANNGPTSLSFNKAKRSSSIDNVISSNDVGSNVTPISSINQYSSNSKILPNSSRNLTITNNYTQKNVPSTSYTTNKNHLNQADLSELLEKFNLTNMNKKKQETPGRGSAYSSNSISNGEVNNSSLTNRSRSLQRDTMTALTSNGDDLETDSNYLDINSLKKSQTKRQLAESAKANNNYSAYNTSNVSNKYSDEIAIILNQSTVNGVNTLSQLQSHVVPKPPPGNPQRNTSLYPAR